MASLPLPKLLQQKKENELETLIKQQVSAIAFSRCVLRAKESYVQINICIGNGIALELSGGSRVLMDALADRFFSNVVPKEFINSITGIPLNEH